MPRFLSATFDKLLSLDLMALDEDNYLLFSYFINWKGIVHYRLEFSEKQKEHIAFHRERVFRVVNYPITTNADWR